MRALITVIAAAVFMLIGVTAIPTARAQDGGALSNETLLKTLNDMKLETKPLESGYLVTVQQNTWTLYVQFVLSNDATKLGMNANLGAVDETVVTAEQWKNLLAANNDLDPSSFVYNAEQKKLYMHRVMDNRSLSSDILQKQLDIFLSDIRNTEKTWGPVAK